MTQNEIRERLLELARVRLKARFGAFEQFRFTLDGLPAGAAILTRAGVMPAPWTVGLKMGLGEAAKQIDDHLLRLIDEWAQQEAPARQIPVLEGLQPLAAEPQAETPSPAPVGDVGASDGVEPDKAGPLPLTTNEIANCFNGFRDWDVKRWKRELGSPDNWLRDCQHSKGTRGKGGYESTWWPVKIALALASQDQKSARHLPARFKRLEQLKPWLEELENNFPVNSESP